MLEKEAFLGNFWGPELTCLGSDVGPHPAVQHIYIYIRERERDRERDRESDRERDRESDREREERQRE